MLEGKERMGKDMLIIVNDLTLRYINAENLLIELLNQKQDYC